MMPEMQLDFPVGRQADATCSEFEGVICRNKHASVRLEKCHDEQTMMRNLEVHIIRGQSSCKFIQATPRTNEEK